MRDTIILIEDLSCTLGGKEILKGVSLAIRQGEYVSIVGPNGSGKTTFLKCLVRIITGWKGRIAIAGKDLERYSQRDLARLIGYVPQTEGRSAPFTVREFVTMARYPYLNPFSASQRRDEEVVKSVLETTETDNLADRLLGDLSGGERQRVFIAAALAQEAPVMLLDEPTTFLDPKHVNDILALLDRINKDHGVTVAAVTHDINAAAMAGGRVIALKEGTTVFCGESREFMTNNVLREIYGIGFHFVEHPVTGDKLVVPGIGK
jgi:iron complex transport system ATP-binding protein